MTFKPTPVQLPLMKEFPVFEIRAKNGQFTRIGPPCPSWKRHKESFTDLKPEDEKISKDSRPPNDTRTTNNTSDHVDISSKATMHSALNRADSLISTKSCHKIDQSPMVNSAPELPADSANDLPVETLSLQGRVSTQNSYEPHFIRRLTEICTCKIGCPIHGRRPREQNMNEFKPTTDEMSLLLSTDSQTVKQADSTLGASVAKVCGSEVSAWKSHYARFGKYPGPPPPKLADLKGVQQDKIHGGLKLSIWPDPAFQEHSEGYDKNMTESWTKSNVLHSDLKSAKSVSSSNIPSRRTYGSPLHPQIASCTGSASKEPHGSEGSYQLRDETFDQMARNIIESQGSLNWYSEPSTRRCKPVKVLLSTDGPEMVLNLMNKCDGQPLQSESTCSDGVTLEPKINTLPSTPDRSSSNTLSMVKPDNEIYPHESISNVSCRPQYSMHTNSSLRQASSNVSSRSNSSHVMNYHSPTVESGGSRSSSNRKCGPATILTESKVTSSRGATSAPRTVKAVNQRSAKTLSASKDNEKSSLIVSSSRGNQGRSESSCPSVGMNFMNTSGCQNTGHLDELQYARYSQATASMSKSHKYAGSYVYENRPISSGSNSSVLTSNSPLQNLSSKDSHHAGQAPGISTQAAISLNSGSNESWASNKSLLDTKRANDRAEKPARITKVHVSW